MAAGGTISASVAELLGLILISINLVATVLLHLLERWAAQRHLYLQTVLRIMYRELMLLGLVSFGFLTVEIAWNPIPADLVVSFEFAHALIFALAVLYAVTVVFSNYASVRLTARWEAAEGTSLADYLDIKTKYRSLRARWIDPRTALSFRVRHYFEYNRLHDFINFHDLRFQFIYYRKLPENFNFTAYLRKVKATVYTHLVDIHWTLWALALIFEAFDLGRRYILRAVSRPGVNTDVDGALIIAFVAFDVVLAIALQRKIKGIYKILSQNPATYYNDIYLEAHGRSGRDSDDDPAPDLDEGSYRASVPMSGDGSGSETSEVPAVPAQDAFAAAQDEAAAKHVPLFARLFDTGGSAVASHVPKHGGDERAGGEGDVVGAAATAATAATGRRASIDDSYLHVEKRSEEVHTRDDIEVGRAQQSPAMAMMSPDSMDEMRGSHAQHAMSFDLPFHRHAAGDGGLSALAGPQNFVVANRSETSFNSRVSIGSGSRQSVDVAAHVPTQELERRRLREMSEVSSQGAESLRKRGSMSTEEGHRPSIILHHEDVRAAAQAAPETDFPRWLLVLVPRLKRVASPVEKLFWFGSHRFFLWSTQLSIFVATFVASIMVAAVAVAAKSFKVLNWVGLGLAIANLIHALVRSAAILKTYTFVINASSLVSEELVEDAVGKVVDTRALKFRDDVRSIGNRSRSENGDEQI